MAPQGWEQGSLASATAGSNCRSNESEVEVQVGRAILMVIGEAAEELGTRPPCQG